MPFLSIRRDRRAPLLLFSTAFAALTVDQLTKLWVRTSLEPGKFWPEHGILRLTNSTNQGIVFGIEAPLAFSIAMPVVLVAIALVAYFWYGPIGGRLVNVCLGLFIGGSLGNLIDRVRFGAVTDFADVRLWGNVHWFTFNVADACIVVGIILFVLSIFGLPPRRDVKERK